MREQSSTNRGWMVWVIITLGVLFSVSAFIVLFRTENDLMAAEVERAGFACVQAVKRAMDRNIEALKAMRALYYSSEEVTRAEFTEFAREEQLWHADATVLGWVPRVPADERADFEAAARRDGLAEFAITEINSAGTRIPAGQRSAFFPVYYLHPQADHDPLLGFDLASEPVRCRTIEAACDNGLLVMTPPVQILHGGTSRRGIFLLMPVYRNHRIPETEEGRKAAFQGFVFARVDCGSIMAMASREFPDGRFHFQLRDARAEPGADEIYTGNPWQPGGVRPPERAGFLFSQLSHSYRVPIADRSWVFELKPLDPVRFEASRRHSWLVFSVGLLITALLAVHHRDTARRNRELEHSNALLRGEITERERAEEILGASEERYRTLFALSPSGILIEDSAGRIIDINPALCASFGYPREELVGASVRLLVPPGATRDVETNIGRILAGETLHHEVRNVRKDGTECNMELWETKATLAGGTECILVVANDITKRTRAAEELRRSEERMRALLSAQPDLMFRLKRDSTCVDYHAPSCDLLLPPEEFVGKRFGEVLPPPLARLTLEHIARVFDTGEISVYEYALPAHGENRIFEARMVASGPDEVLVIVRDVTEKRRRDEETGKTQRLESLGLLAGGIAHDFNNILTTILGNISLVKMAGTWSEPDRQRLLSDAEHGAARAKDLTQQLLTFAKGGMPVKQTASLGDLLTESATFALRGSSSRLELRLPPGLWHAEVDPGQIGQVIHNLVINADQAMPGGGIVTISAENITLDGQIALPLRPGPYVSITVADTGIGVPPEHMERIFDPYFTTKQKGSGLGLTTSFSIIKKHGGHIVAESRAGIGTAFHIYVPALPGSHADDTPAVSGTTKVVSCHSRVLVMDDEAAIRTVVSLMLESVGCQVQKARDGSEAIAAFAAARSAGTPFDIVVLDLTIPGGMGGKETLAKLRELDPQVKAIVSSGYSNDPVLASHEQYGFAGVVAKPFRQEDLLDAINKALAAG